MCVDAGTISIWRDLKSDVNWKTELNSTNQLATRHTDGLALMTTFETEAEHILARLCDKSVITMKNT